MPTDATGTPTSLGIRKYNTSADAPSGLGFNGAMDDIDALLKTLGIGSLVTSDVPVWDSGTGKFKKATGSHTGTNFLRDDGTWASAASGPGSPSTTLPGSPTEAQQVLFVDNVVTPSYIWLLQWSGNVGKWVFLGGTPLYAEVTAAEATASVTYAALTTAGPTVTLPRIGTYTVDLGCRLGIGTGGNGFMSYDIGGTGAVDADAVVNSLPNSNPTVMRRRTKTFASAATLTSKYKNDATLSTTFANRWISVLPVTVS